MTLFVVSDAWRAAYPEGVVGILALRAVANPVQHPALGARKRALEAELRARYAPTDPDALKQDPTLAAYAAYYRRFKKTYHVRQQLESVAQGEADPGARGAGRGDVHGRAGERPPHRRPRPRRPAPAGAARCRQR